MTNSHQPGDLKKLSHIIETLRGEKGCPWDQKQTPKSIIKYLLEESNELAEAIEKNDTDNVQEELGDLFFILTIITSMYEEKQQFTMTQVLDGICEKMIRRHPHVYQGEFFENEKDLRRQWQEIKIIEKQKK